VKPRLAAASNTSTTSGSSVGEGGGGGNMVEGVEGPIKGVDTSKLKF
jgi:hypothetical protein